MGRLFAIIQKEMRHLLRDKRTLGMITIMPLLQVLIYGFAIDVDVKHLRMAVQDEDRTPLSRRLIAQFAQTGYFDIATEVQDPKTLQQQLDRGHVKAALHIPPDFAKDLYAGRHSRLQMLIDGTDSTPASVALNTGQAIVTAFMQREGLVPMTVVPIEYHPRLWYNPDLKSAYFFVPGLVGFLLMFIIPMLTATSIVREKEGGTIEQLLVTPVQPWEIIVGKMLPYLGIGVIMATLILSAAYLVFGVPIRGNLFTLYSLILVFLIAYLGIGLLASAVAHTQQQATQTVMLLMTPSVLLSGFIFPRESMPWSIAWIGNLIPLTYFLKIVRGIVLKGLGFADLWDQILPLAGMAVLVIVLSVRKFHKRLD